MFAPRRTSFQTHAYIRGSPKKCSAPRTRSGWRRAARRHHRAVHRDGLEASDNSASVIGYLLRQHCGSAFDCPGGALGRPFVRMPASRIATNSGKLDRGVRSFHICAGPQSASLPVVASVPARRARVPSAGRPRTIATSDPAAIGTVRHTSRRWRAAWTRRG